MNTKILHIPCPDYQFKNLDIVKVSKCIDDILISNFANQKVVIRGVQSKKHNLPKEKFVEQILENGSDRYDLENENEVKVSDKPIDLFGYGCVAKSPMTLSVLEGFHKWKPMSLERPQQKVDIWMIYDASQLDNVEYDHSYYHVKAKDGYTFKDTKNKQKSLLGLLLID